MASLVMIFGVLIIALPISGKCCHQDAPPAMLAAPLATTKPPLHLQ